jgi:NAD-dependent DNA ligase
MSIGRLMASESHKLRKSCESLLGICTGIMADEKLNEQEIRFLDLWLKDNADIANVWPGDVIARRVRDVLADNVVTEDELKHLQEALKELIGGTLQDTGAVNGLSTRLPINDEKASPLIFKESSFCFTGNFIFGTRASCERAITERGALAVNNVIKDLGYLVIGTMVSSEWANTSHGRKIEKAVEYQNIGCPILIISEAHWVKHL